MHDWRLIRLTNPDLPATDESHWEDLGELRFVDTRFGPEGRGTEYVDWWRQIMEVTLDEARSLVPPLYPPGLRELHRGTEDAQNAWLDSLPEDDRYAVLWRDFD